MAIHLEAVRSAGSRANGSWLLRAGACKIEFTLRYEIDDGDGAPAGPVFERIANTMIDAFVARADQDVLRPGPTEGTLVSHTPPIAPGDFTNPPQGDSTLMTRPKR